MKNLVIAGYCRCTSTPAQKGQLAKVRPDDLVAQIVKALINDPELFQKILKI